MTRQQADELTASRIADIEQRIKDTLAAADLISEREPIRAAIGLRGLSMMRKQLAELRGGHYYDSELASR